MKNGEINPSCSEMAYDWRVSVKEKPYCDHVPPSPPNPPIPTPPIDCSIVNSSLCEILNSKYEFTK